MNIVTVIPNSFGYPTNSVGTDAVRRDNVLREAIPSVTQGERSAAERGLASDGERNSQAANQANLFQNPTYERPTVSQAFANNLNGEANKDNADQESAGKENAESKQEQQNDDKKVDDKEVRGLRERDREVRMHEQAHSAVGGQYAGAPSYEYESGPDGKRYAVGGEVSMDVSAEKTPADTIRKMQQVKAAALAPAEPSGQDYKVAADATQKEQSARSELAKEQAADVSPNASPQTDVSMAGIDAGRQVLQADLELNEQAQRTAVVVSSFYAGVFAQSQSSLNFTV
ncbi:MAG: hypothetical protein ACJAWT_001592 [Glaciecola sp.]|jgi:hypothetical protein